MADERAVLQNAQTASEPSWALREVMRAAGTANLALARELGLGLNDLAALEHLSEHQPLGPAELGSLLGIRSASATALVDRLEAAGHVSRRRHPADRRRLVLVITPQATARMIGVLGPLVAQLDAVAAELTAAEREVVVRYLRHAAGVLRAHHQSPSAAGSEG